MPGLDRGRRFASVAAAFVLSLATVSLAQDYTVSRVDGVYETPPVDATDLELGTGDVVRVDLPFVFTYYGAQYDTAWVSGYGYLLFDPVATPTRSYNNGRFPPPDEAPVSDVLDGCVAAYWDELDTDVQGDVLMHVAGAAPNREVVITWLSCKLRAGDADLSFQARLEEGTGVIRFGYGPEGDPSTWPDSSSVSNYTVGLSAPQFDDDRFLIPGGISNEPVANAGHPGQDIVLTPVLTTFEGRVVMDVLESDATGIGNTTTEDVVVADTTVDLRWGPDGTRLVERIATDSLGRFAITGRALPSDGSVVGTFRVYAETPDGAVRESAGGEVTSYQVLTDVDFTASQQFDDVVLDETNDTTGDFRGALHVLMTIGEVRDFVTTRTNDAVAPLDVLYDPQSGAASGYTAAAGPSDAVLRIASGGSGNPDPWDDAVITRVYARHVLDSIAALPTTTADATFDGVTDAQNAFAEAFGYFLHTAVTGASEAFDGVGESSTTTIDLEDPDPLTPRAPDVTAWVAAQLHDLADADDEPEDRVDGGGPGALDRPFELVDAMTTPGDAVDFFESWGHGRPDATNLARLAIHNGIVTDDDFEPNDDAGEPADVGPVPFEVTDRTLTLYDEDWLACTLPAAADELIVELTLGGALDATNVVVELRSAGGTVLATAEQAEGQEGLLVASAPSPPAGTYHIRVRHASGAVADTYRVQAFVPLTLTQFPLREWTVDRPYDESVGAVGGLPPLVLERDGDDPLPTGLLVQEDTDRVAGLPSEAGEFTFGLRVTDSGTPQHALVRSQSLVINPPLTVDLGPFVAFPLDRPHTIERAEPGGTAPRVFGVGSGALPDGISLAADALQLAGTATAPGSSVARIDGEDVAGSADGVETMAVVCVPGDERRAPADLAAGDAACGYTFDAVAGSTATLLVATARRQPRRALAPVVLRPDGATPIDDARLRSGRGRASAVRVNCPTTGRYFFVVASPEGDATELLGTLRVRPPRRGRERVDDFGPSDAVTVEFGALEGARLVFRAIGDRRAGVDARITTVTAPDGTTLFRPDLDVRGRGPTEILRLDLDQSGTWRVRLTGDGGTPGRIRYVYRLRQPRGVSYSAD